MTVIYIGNGIGFCDIQYSIYLIISISILLIFLIFYQYIWYYRYDTFNYCFKYQHHERYIARYIILETLLIRHERLILNQGISSDFLLSNTKPPPPPTSDTNLISIFRTLHSIANFRCHKPSTDIDTYPTFLNVGQNQGLNSANIVFNFLSFHCMLQTRIKKEYCDRPMIGSIKHCHIL